MERYGRIVKVKPEKLEYYKKLHADPWPEVSDAIGKCNLRNFSIYYKDGYLFSYYEYVGNDYQKDIERLSELTRNWLNETDPCQQPIETAKNGELWVDMLELFHQD
jgi:L-rhamnose mutarotase